MKIEKGKGWSDDGAAAARIRHLEWRLQLQSDKAKTSTDIAKFASANDGVPRDQWRGRDYQKSKVYRAENPVHYTTDKFATIVEAEAWVRDVMANAQVREAFADTRLAPEPGVFWLGEKANRCYANVAGIHLSRRGLNKGIVLHELAHYLIWKQNWVAAHGREFVRAMIRLFQIMLGAEKANELHAALAAGKVASEGSDRDYFIAAKKRSAASERSRARRLERELNKAKGNA